MVIENNKNQSWNGKERRRFPRLSDKMRIFYGLSSQKAWQEVGREMKSRVESLSKLHIDSPVITTTTNCSPVGICVQTAAPIRIGTILELKMFFDDKNEKIEGLGRVVWNKPLLHNAPNVNPADSPDSYLIGIEFVATNNGIASFIMQNIALGLIRSCEEISR